MLAPILTGKDKLRAIRIIGRWGRFTLSLSFHSGAVVEQQFTAWDDVWLFLRQYDPAKIRMADILIPVDPD